MIKRLLPKSLFGRSVMIIVTPLILLQIVATWVFYDRHWETITRRLASAVAGEISMVIEGMRRFPGEENRSMIIGSSSVMGLHARFREDEILPNRAPEIGSGILDRRLNRALQVHVRRPFHMDSWTYDRDVRIQVQLTNGVLDVYVPRERLFSSTTYIFVMWMVGTSLILFAVASIFMRNQVRPIRRLAELVDNFGKGREVSDFKPEGATEIRVAAAAFNAMRERIQRNINQRTEMLAGVSHDLRTPLTRMKLQLAMLGDGAEVRDLQADVAEMESMVQDYLSFARGEGTEAVVTANISELLDDVANSARRNGATVDLTVEPSLEVPVRPNAFKRCVSNIVSNAIRSADHVAIQAGRRGENIEIFIDDDGPGIPEDQREEVFKPFYRLDSSRNPETGGTGLGLTIARDVMRSHGGDVRLDKAPDGGLRACLRLPV